MKLSELIQPWVPLDPALDCEVTELVLDSRQIQPGDVFVAYRGAVADGRNFIGQAKLRGAVAALVEAPFNSPYPTFPCIEVPNLPAVLTQLAARTSQFNPSQTALIGVTGTNGKTTCCHLLAQLVPECARIGTLGTAYQQTVLPTETLTTPDPFSLHKYLHWCQQAGAATIAMEVSSHALAQARVAGLRFKRAIFTNLSMDHLDYHETLEAYFQAKAKLFLEYQPELAIINADDVWGRKLIQACEQAQLPYQSFSLEDASATWYWPYQPNQPSMIQTPAGPMSCDSPLIGRFNAANLLACLACAHSLGATLADLQDRIQILVAPPGRLEQVARRPQVVVDFAHTPDGLVQVLQTLRESLPHAQAKLWCVIGCGGDRCRSKRPHMLQAARRFADWVMITSDNPRSEDPAHIAQEMLGELPVTTTGLILELERARAIEIVVARAAPDDIICLAGKGHEATQVVGKRVIYGSDKQLALAALSKRETLCSH